MENNQTSLIRTVYDQKQFFCIYSSALWSYWLFLSCLWNKHGFQSSGILSGIVHFMFPTIIAVIVIVIILRYSFFGTPGFQIGLQLILWWSLFLAFHCPRKSVPSIHIFDIHFHFLWQRPFLNLVPVALKPFFISNPVTIFTVL